MSQLLTTFLWIFIVHVPSKVFSENIPAVQFALSDINNLETRLFQLLTKFDLPQLNFNEKSLVFDRLNEIINPNSIYATNAVNNDVESIFFKLLDVIVINVDPLYKKFLAHIRNKTSLDEDQVSTENLLHDVVQLANTSSIQILNLITDLEMNKNRREYNPSTPSAILDVYKLTTRAIVRVYIIRRYSSDASTMLKSQNLTTIELQNQLKISNYQKNIKTAINLASKIQISSQVPMEQKRYETFIELENSLRYKLTHTIDVAEESCNLECDIYRENTTFYHCTSATDMCTWQNIMKRQLFPNTLQMNITTSNIVYTPFGTTFQMLENFVIDTLRLIGIGDIKSSIPFNNLHVSLLPDCRQCACYCTHSFEDPNSIQAISFLEAAADTANNKVVTGVQFVLQEKMVHIKIKQGTLGPFAQIQRATDDWMELPDVKWNNQSSRTVFNLEGINLIPDYSFARVVQATFVNSIIALKTLVVPQGHVITGLRMNYEKQSYIDEVAPFGLEVQSTPFNFVTGELKPSESEWLKSEWLQRKDQQVRSNILMHNDKYSNFGVVMLNNKTMVTLPYFDATPVTTLLPTALRGISLSLRNGIDGAEKYLTMSLLHLDMSDYMV